jgi:ATP-dependent Clp protease ATP-binding subunit ClpC
MDNKNKAFNEEEDDSQRLDKLKSKSKSTTPVLDNFGKDLTKLASLGKLDAVIGRDEEIDQTIQILNKRKKNNPILVGAPGAGKTAIVEGLAIRIFNKQVDRWLFNKRIIELNITSVVSGTKYRGEFEQRMEEIIKEIQKNPDVIIFIDEIHNVIGAGGASGTMDAANIIKPALSRGEMRCIGATTTDEYKKVIENDSALDRRFQKVYIKVPSKEETVDILKQIRGKYEDYHGVIYSDEIIDKCVELSDRYITYRNFPDKAIDLLDEVGSRVKLSNTVVSEEIKKLEAALKEAEQKKREAASLQDYEGAAKYRDMVRDLTIQIEEENISWQKKNKQTKIPVKLEDVAGIVAKQIGIPLNKLTDSENEKLLQLDDYLKSRVIGQDGAVSKITDAIQRSRLGIQDPNKPISFLFLGATGVGKTQLAKVLSKYMFDTDDSFIRFDMSEYGEKFSVNKLIGSPPGYVGHEDKGQLTERVKNRPYCILLFDEIEKAHPDIFNILLQIFDDGRLTDSHGKEVNFKNAIIIMTSNIGTEKIVSDRTLGFGSLSSQAKTESINDKVMAELKKVFKPELINRIDEKIVFNVLSEEDIIKIVEIELNKTLERVEQKGYKINVDHAVKKFIADNGYDKDYGARPLKRTIMTHIETPIAKHLLSKKVKPGATLKLRYDEKENIIVVK